jgi:transketolase
MPKATRTAFGEALARIGKTNERIVVVDADLGCSTMTRKFADAFPDRFFQVGIAEGNMVGISAGLALGGMIPFAASFACFIAGRFEQIRMSVGYNDANVKIVGTHAGVGIGEDGYSQMGLEDIALMRTLPNMIVVQPADAIETERATEYLAEHAGPSYFRLTRQPLADLNDSSYRFEL